ncbi:MAG: YbdK family carboxylate-amine ligase [Phycisphaerales bacterium]|nr:MAG: YbdK family carboxylate-amine ligase [Phycisphaerales bacterium]
MKEFVPNDFPTVGVEQEFHLVDARTGELAPCVDRVLENITERMRGSVCYELFHSVLEHNSAVFRTVDDLVENVAEARRELAEACAKVGAALAAAGSHAFSDWRDQTIVPSDHYQWVASECVYSARRMVAFGLHIHVGMRSAESAMYTMYEMRRWIYPLLALSANSPYFEGQATGLASTRTHLFGSMPRTHVPPEFEDMAELDAFYRKLIACGDVTAPGDLWWAIRPQPPLGTVELRVFDLPTDVRRLGALAAITQAAMAMYQDKFGAGAARTPMNPAYILQNRWKAMRHGLEGKVLDPATGEVVPIREQLERLLDSIGSKAEELGSIPHIEFAFRMLEEGTEAQWQLKTCEQLGGDLRALELEIAKQTLGGERLGVIEQADRGGV